MVKVKICGITNLEDALASINSGCDALGLVFYKKSPRYIAPRKASSLIKALSGKPVVKIGVFVNSRIETIKRISRLCKLDMLQFHGRESADFCKKFKNYKIIKAFRVRNSLGSKELSKYKVFAFLFDTFSKEKIGGTGKKFNWKLIRHIGNLKRPVILSGGLTVKNVKEAINKVHPNWVDVSSGVEASLGKKDHKKVRAFIRAAKS